MIWLTHSLTHWSKLEIGNFACLTVLARPPSSHIFTFFWRGNVPKYDWTMMTPSWSFTLGLALLIVKDVWRCVGKLGWHSDGIKDQPWWHQGWCLTSRSAVLFALQAHWDPQPECFPDDKCQNTKKESESVNTGIWCLGALWWWFSWRQICSLPIWWRLCKHNKESVSSLSPVIS